jgi:hypothetical protein
VGVGAALHAAEIKESTFTQVIHDVNVVSAATRAAQPALTNALVKAPDLVRTGAKSRAELQAPNRTLIRLGANTVFSFDNLGKLVMASNLVQGFLHPLPSLPKILEAIEKQDSEIATGRIQDTGYLVAGSASQNDVKVLAPGLVDTVFPPFRDTTITAPNLEPTFISQGKIAYGNGADSWATICGNRVIRWRRTIASLRRGAA